MRSSRNLAALVAAWALGTAAVVVAPSAQAGAESAPAVAASAMSSAQTGATTGAGNRADKKDKKDKKDKGKKQGGSERPSSGDKPAVLKISPKVVDTSGGQQITITGDRLKRVKYVKIGTTRIAAGKARRGGTKLKVVVPAGFPGKATVRVKTREGMSAKSKRTKLTYQDAAPVTLGTLTPKQGTVTGTAVQWVTGGTDVTNPVVGQLNNWVVGVGPGGAVPAIGATYFLAPGSPSFPSGLTGTVSDISEQPGGVRAVTVTPSGLGASLSAIDVRYVSGPSSTRASDSFSEVQNGGVIFSGLDSRAFNCKNDRGQTVAFRGSLGLKLENLRTNIEIRGGALTAPYLNTWVRYQPVLTGTITAEAAMTCAPSTLWTNAHRKVFLVPGTGLTLSFAPSAEFKVTAAGTVTISNRGQRMVGAKYEGGRMSNIDVSEDLGTTVNGALSFGVDASAGVSVQFGVLDRVGIEGKALVAAAGSVKAAEGNVCVDLSLGFRVEIGAFLDLVVVRFESPYYKKTFPFKRLQKCAAPAAPANPSGPQITSSRLPQASTNKPFSAQLTTADNRGGRWGLVVGGLPVGLTLNPNTGVVSGTPSGQVRDYAAAVQFTDGSGQIDIETVRVQLGPDTVGSGRLQATLTWGSAADLDLHVVDPSGEEIYYQHETSTSGGVLDRDANAGCGEALAAPIENIFWPSTGAPAGTYRVSTVVYSACGSRDLTWHLVVRVGGQVVLDRTGSGTSPSFDVPVR